MGTTDREIVLALKSKRESLLIQLKKIEVALGVFATNGHAVAKPSTRPSKVGMTHTAPGVTRNKIAISVRQYARDREFNQDEVEQWTRLAPSQVNGALWRMTNIEGVMSYEGTKTYKLTPKFFKVYGGAE